MNVTFVDPIAATANLTRAAIFRPDVPAIGSDPPGIVRTSGNAPVVPTMSVPSNAASVRSNSMTVRSTSQSSAVKSSLKARPSDRP